VVALQLFLILLVFLFLALPFVLVKRRGVEGPSKVQAVNSCVLAIWVPWAPLLQELLELLLRI
jgi:hypothetical protein